MCVITITNEMNELAKCELNDDLVHNIYGIIYHSLCADCTGNVWSGNIEKVNILLHKELIELRLW
jgi:hypothetical protein